MAEIIKAAANWVAEPTRYSLITAGLLAATLKWRKQLTHPLLFIGVVVLAAGFFAFAWDDPNFNKIITKPDNVPIIILLGSVVFFTWLALRRAVVNDERIARGEPTLEGELAKNKVFVWPDLVYTELICLILFTAFLILWSILIQAPIEEPASQARTPNPSKAPWYFLGLQELLVYFDPWIAGVLLPSFIIVGLCAIPYLDRNPRGNGYYTFSERSFAVSFFMVGFILMWVSLVIMGTFLRGPNWAFFGPFEYWDHLRLDSSLNVNLSEVVWVKLLGVNRPAHPLVRELPGILGLLGYFLLLPPLLGMTLFRRMASTMGPIRFNVMMHLFLWTALVPVKMVGRWVFALKYIIAIPEWFLNV